MATRIELEAIAAALESWGEPEVWGIARDATHEALAHGVVRDGVLVIDDPIVLEREQGDVVTLTAVLVVWRLLRLEFFLAKTGWYTVEWVGARRVGLA